MALAKEYRNVTEKIEQGLQQVVNQLRAILNSNALYDDGLEIIIRHPHTTAVLMLKEHCPSMVLRVPIKVEHNQ